MGAAAPRRARAGGLVDCALATNMHTHMHSHLSVQCPAQQLLEHVAWRSTHSYLLEDVLRHLLAQTSCYPAQPPTLDKILFVVMCGTDSKQHVEWMHETWLP
jgi:hypothetical protein